MVLFRKQTKYIPDQKSPAQLVPAWDEVHHFSLIWRTWIRQAQARTQHFSEKIYYVLVRAFKMLEGLFRCVFFLTASAHRDTPFAHVFDNFERMDQNLNFFQKSAD